MSRLGAVVGLVLAWAFPGLPQADTRIEVERPVWNFGLVSNRIELVHEFQIRNATPANPASVRVISSCDACLSISPGRLRIPPGGVGFVTCRLDLRGLSGPVERLAWMEIEGASQAPLALSLTGSVFQVFHTWPKQIDLDLSAGRSVGQADIVSTVGLRAALSTAWCDDPHLVADVAPTGTNRAVVTVRVLDSHPRGRTPFRVVVRSTDTNDPACTLTGTVCHPPDFEVLPPELRFAPTPEPQERILWIRQRGPSVSILLDAVPPSDRFRCELERDPTGANYKVYVVACRQHETDAPFEPLVLRFRDASGREWSHPIPVSCGREEDQSRALGEPVVDVAGMENAPRWR